MKRIVYTLLFIFSVSINFLYNRKGSLFGSPLKQKLQVVVSFNAMRELAQAIGGNKIEIKTIIPNGVELPDFESKVSDVTALSHASFFIINEFGMEQA